MVINEKWHHKHCLLSWFVTSAVTANSKRLYTAFRYSMISFSTYLLSNSPSEVVAEPEALVIQGAPNTTHA